MKEYKFDSPLSISAARDKFYTAGIEYTSWGVMSVARRMGFGKKVDRHWIFDSEGIDDFINEMNSLPPRNWVSVLYINTETGISKKRIYQILSTGKVAYEYFLFYRMIFVDYPAFLDYVKQMNKGEIK